MQLYNFYRSGTSHRLRIALNLKGLDFDYVAIHLGKDEHHSAAFKALNPQGLVPALVLDDGLVLMQSPAIIEWLEERHPTPALLPVLPQDRARVRALAALVGCDIHPLNNRRVLEYLRQQLGCEDAAVNAWCATWITAGFEALENLLAADTRRGDYCFGNTPTLADVYLVPQVESARRFKVDLSPYPHICAIDEACGRLPAFQMATPGVQLDAT
ncbi:MAG: maleylacetoacetate isomerase [Rhodoferax sp.]|nr:maleylacetoacetate isomerase [Rhodoferax sp.]